MALVGLAVSLALTTWARATVFPDQNYPFHASTSQGCGGFEVLATEWIAQTFTPSLSGELKRVVLPIGGALYFPIGGSGPVGTLPAEVVISITAVDAAGEPDLDIAAELASTSLPLSDATNSGPATTIVFDTPAAVVAGTKYAIVLSVASDSSVIWRGDIHADIVGQACPAGTYAGGNGFTSNAGVDASADFFFQTFVDSVSPPKQPVPPPGLGKTVVVSPVSGSVLVRRPGSASFVPLAAGTSIPVGTEFDTTKGTVKLVSATTRTGVTQASNFFGGRFIVAQSRDGLVSLRLSGGDFKAACPPARKRAPSVAQKTPSRTVRKLWGDGKGRFRTRGRYASAAVRGTLWLTADRCDGTLVSVRRGRVTVVDIPKRKQLVVIAGRSYIAAKP